MTSHGIADVRLRVATPDDAAALQAIYEPYVVYTALTFECHVPTVEEFRGRIGATLQNYPYLVALVDGVPTGYTYASRFKPREAYGWSVETSIYVRQDMRKHGLGRKMYEALESVLVLQNVYNMCACAAHPFDQPDEYSSTNSADFHAHMGFKYVGRFHGCASKFGRWYDIMWFDKTIIQRDGAPKPFVPFPQITAEQLHALGIEA